jgi:hypothetical protein
MKQLFALAVVFAGCADNRETLFVRQVNAFDDECVVKPDPGSIFHTGGTLDVAYRGSYVLTPVMENQMVARENHDSVRVESNGIQIDGAIVRLYEAGDQDLPPEETAPVLEFFSYASSYIEPEAIGASIFTAIPPEYTERRYRDLCGFDPGGYNPGSYNPSTDLVLIGATVQGTTNGGIAVESPEFFFPVDLCCGCLLTCSPEADDPDFPGFCDSTDELTDKICVLGQDGLMDCRLTAGSGDDFLFFASQCDPNFDL